MAPSHRSRESGIDSSIHLSSAWATTPRARPSSGRALFADHGMPCHGSLNASSPRSTSCNASMVVPKSTLLILSLSLPTSPCSGFIRFNLLLLRSTLRLTHPVVPLHVLSLWKPRWRRNSADALVGIRPELTSAQGFCSSCMDRHVLFTAVTFQCSILVVCHLSLPVAPDW